jgi:hypothetical protein
MRLALAYLEKGRCPDALRSLIVQRLYPGLATLAQAALSFE